MRRWHLIFLLFLLVLGHFAQSWLKLDIETYITGISRADINTNALVLENQSLKAQLAQLRAVTHHFASSSANPGVTAFVYSRYPFNFRNTFLLTAGSKQGIQAGYSVVVPCGCDDPSARFLLGQIANVSPDQSAAMTIFDTRWKSAVKIGASGSEALLEGGMEPHLTLIPKNAPIEPGDVVYSTDAAFPYGLAIANIKEVTLTKDKTFKTATLNFGYDLAGLSAVEILPHEK